jgi:translation initiation factor 5B
MRKSKKKRNTFADLDQDDDESKPAGIEEVRANPDDEWPEEDVKPKKGKKSKKAKAKAQADTDDEEEVEEVPEVKAAPANVEKAVEKEVEEKDDEDDEGPKVSLSHEVCNVTDHVAPY